MKFNVPDMSCAHCSGAIEKGIAAIDPGAAVITDLAARTVTVVTARSATEIAAAIKAAGYDVAAA